MLISLCCDLFLLCCANFVVLRLVSVVLSYFVVLRLVSIVLFNFIVLCYFRCVVVILLCCGLFPLCCGDFVVCTGPPYPETIMHNTTKSPQHNENKP